VRIWNPIWPAAADSAVGELSTPWNSCCRSWLPKWDHITSAAGCNAHHEQEKETVVDSAAYCCSAESFNTPETNSSTSQIEPLQLGNPSPRPAGLAHMHYVEDAAKHCVPGPSSVATACHLNQLSTVANESGSLCGRSGGRQVSHASVQPSLPCHATATLASNQTAWPHPTLPAGPQQALLAATVAPQTLSWSGMIASKCWCALHVLKCTKS
jgi:hypothetical protein